MHVQNGVRERVWNVTWGQISPVKAHNFKMWGLETWWCRISGHTHTQTTPTSCTTTSDLHATDLVDFNLRQS